MCISNYFHPFLSLSGSGFRFCKLETFFFIIVCLCAVKPVVPRCSVPEAVTVGTSTELRCLENEGFPAPMYRWFHNNEELPQDSKTSPKFVNSSYSINPDTGGLVRQEEIWYWLIQLICLFSSPEQTWSMPTRRIYYFCFFNCTTCTSKKLADTIILSFNSSNVDMDSLRRIKS